jgi:hypothetical protein
MTPLRVERRSLSCGRGGDLSFGFDVAREPSRRGTAAIAHSGGSAATAFTHPGSGNL